ncbi:MAG: hypothetical protein IIC96_01675 [Chloroflexi bacterium]|nr:hypothetical protein [Chloroflexota bacterium]MCH8350426.1 hypothetical protein [Chloroflexota bacterium]MCI0786355.1 hypothetical protein [Chloroflexota bacterium]MCI0878462.1 hypothetical protein [Chloroflexota bacterium]
MTVELLALLASYLESKLGIDSIRKWIAVKVWDRLPESRDYIDQVAVELAYIDDGVSDEEGFRIRMAEFLVPTVIVGEPAGSTIAVASGASQVNLGLWGQAGTMETAFQGYGFNLHQEVAPGVEALQPQVVFE